MKRILFVDDEPKVLQGLHRMLRSLRREWDMEFAEGGREALARLAASPCDVVVTDMRMPGMDGADLLHEVMRLYPGTVRIILSGQCDRPAVLKCVGPAHQFLTKPCDSAILKATVARACSLRDHMVDPRHRCAVSRVTSVPSHPFAYAELLAELELPQPSMRRIGEIVSGDVGMAAKTLQLVSSGFFGTPQRLSDPARAVWMLGLETIRPLAFSTEAFVPCEGGLLEDGRLERLIDHSLTVAAAARAIAESETADGVLIGDAFLAGFLHEVGMLALARPVSGHNEPQPSPDAAVAGGGEARAYAGAYLMALWGLPDPIVTAIALQQSPSRSPDPCFTPLTALHVADTVLADAGGEPDGVSPATDFDYLKRIGCFDRLERWRDLCRAAEPQGASR